MEDDEIGRSVDRRIVDDNPALSSGPPGAENDSFEPSMQILQFYLNRNFQKSILLQ